METWSVFLLLLAFAAATDVIYPGQLDHDEGDDCPTRSGEIGTCSRSCKHSANLKSPRKCGIKNSDFLICCEKPLRGNLLAVTDIAPPSVTFQCGRNLRNSFFLSLFSNFGGLLRPEAPPLPRISIVQKALWNFGTNLPGIPPKRLSEERRKFAERLSPGVAPAIGGVDAEKNGWPWMALVGERSSDEMVWFCGAVLINELWVISALHCLFFHTAEVIRLGEHNYNDDKDGAVHQDFGVAKTVLYPDYISREAYHDLALLRLDQRVTIQEFISPVCLPWGSESDRDITAQKATLTGWGDTQFDGFPSSILQEVNVTVFPSATCDRSYSTLPHYAHTWPHGIGKETVCAGDPKGGRDACQGDSGGPLVSQDARGRFVLAGVAVRGYGCGHKDYPGMYANMRHPPYLAWIKKVAFPTS